MIEFRYDLNIKLLVFFELTCYICEVIKIFIKNSIYRKFTSVNIKIVNLQFILRCYYEKNF